MGQNKERHWKQKHKKKDNNNGAKNDRGENNTYMENMDENLDNRTNEPYQKHNEQEKTRLDNLRQETMPDSNKAGFYSSRSSASDKSRKEVSVDNSSILQSIKTTLNSLTKWVNDRGQSCALNSDVLNTNKSVRNVGNDVKDVGNDVKDLKNLLEGIDDRIGKRPNKKYFDDAKESAEKDRNFIKGEIKKLMPKVEDETGSVIKAVRGLVKTHNNTRDNLLGRINDLEGTIKTVSETTELMQSLPGKVDGIAETLTAKGLSLKQEFPTINHEEETIAELAECGEKILQQLALAARWYARRLPELNAHDEALKNLNSSNEKAKAEARKQGFEAGKRAVIKDLLSKYDEESIFSLMNPSDPAVALEQLNVLATFLGNQGVEPIYQLYEEMELREDERMNYEHNIAEFAPGKIVITSPGYTFDSQTISRARYQWYDEFHAAQQTESATKNWENTPGTEVAERADMMKDSASDEGADMTLDEQNTPSEKQSEIVSVPADATYEANEEIPAVNMGGVENADTVLNKQPKPNEEQAVQTEQNVQSKLVAPSKEGE